MFGGSVRSTLNCGITMDEPSPVLTDTTALARRLGISRWAVSRALNGQPGVSEQTRSRVRDAATKAGFEPNVHARTLRAGRTAATATATVGVALPSLRDPAWMFLAGGLCEGLLIRGMEPDLTLGPGESAGEHRVWSRYAAKHVLAILVLGAAAAPTSTGAENSSPAWGQLRRREVPVIFVEPAWTSDPDGFTTVRADHRAAGALVAAHLHAAGHRRIGLHGFDVRQPSRADLLRAACEARGLTCEVAGTGAGKTTGSFPSTRSHAHPTQARRGADSPVSPLPRGRPATRPTALVAADDLTALRLLCQLRAEGRSVPRDQSLVGYGDEPASALGSPGLTTVDPQLPQMVARTLELLDELVRDPTGTRAGCFWIAPLLRVRGSVAHVPQAPA